MDLAQWRERQQSGITVDAEAQDAAVHEEGAEQEYENPEIVDDELDGDEGIDQPDEDDPSEHEDPAADAEEIELPENQKTAFQKALEREKRKMQEEYDRQRTELEGQNTPYKEFFKQLGIDDPSEALKAVEAQKIRQQAEQLAYDNGWTDEQAEYYLQTQLEQQKQAEELHDLRVSVQISELADNPDYAGIKQMKDPIKKLIKESGGKLTADQAYWAIGGPDRAKQLKREAEQREIAKRSKSKRTVQTDTPAATGGDKPLPKEVQLAAREAGISENEARRLMDMPNDLASYRDWKKKQGRG